MERCSFGLKQKSQKKRKWKILSLVIRRIYSLWLYYHYLVKLYIRTIFDCNFYLNTNKTEQVISHLLLSCSLTLILSYFI